MEYVSGIISSIVTMITRNINNFTLEELMKIIFNTKYDIWQQVDSDLRRLHRKRVKRILRIAKKYFWKSNLIINKTNYTIKFSNKTNSLQRLQTDADDRLRSKLNELDEKGRQAALDDYMDQY